jgi:drug/metabolite transporter (DMT)-like permease
VLAEGQTAPAGAQTATTTYRGQEVTVVRGLLPLGSPVRLTTPFFNIYGLFTLVGGAIWSAYLFWRKRVLPNRVIGNVLIAAGALLIGSASTLTRLGYGQFLYLGELLSAIMMFAGFRVAARPQPQEAPQGATAAAD